MKSGKKKRNNKSKRCSHDMKLLCIPKNTILYNGIACEKARECQGLQYGYPTSKNTGGKGGNYDATYKDVTYLSTDPEVAKTYAKQGRYNAVRVYRLNKTMCLPDYTPEQLFMDGDELKEENVCFTKSGCRGYVTDWKKKDGSVDREVAICHSRKDLEHVSNIMV